MGYEVRVSIPDRYLRIEASGSRNIDDSRDFFAALSKNRPNTSSTTSCSCSSSKADFQRSRSTTWSRVTRKSASIRDTPSRSSTRTKNPLPTRDSRETSASFEDCSELFSRPRRTRCAGSGRSRGPTRGLSIIIYEAAFRRQLGPFLGRDSPCVAMPAGVGSGLRQRRLHDTSIGTTSHVDGYGHCRLARFRLGRAGSRQNTVAAHVADRARGLDQLRGRPAVQISSRSARPAGRGRSDRHDVRARLEERGS